MKHTEGDSTGDALSLVGHSLRVRHPVSVLKRGVFLSLLQREEMLANSKGSITLSETECPEEKYTVYRP